MKIFRTLFLLASLSTAFVSCSKDDEAKSMAGTWEGLWGFDQESPSNYERWEFKKNGDFSAFDYDGDLYAKGDWTIDGTEFNATYTSETSENRYSFKGDYNETTKEITGTWGLTPSVTNRGLFVMTKQ